MPGGQDSFPRLGHWRDYAEAIEDSEICRLGAEEQVVRLEERLADLALLPLAARVASTLLGLAGTAQTGRFGQNRPVRRTNRRASGRHREATSKTLTDFSSQGIVRQGRGRITIQDVAALRLMARRAAARRSLGRTGT
ncbi:helix-turn-helix domain-containing protein [Arthrobacter sp. M4]|uniref:helix-turn-helix domain-containing protein n=1 Tax=Arthrobacter sp. M4 TaxID=218160 RepID=UPI001CDCF19A|nr:helix-turn-helix domain-containing protein [Arthrobacter sp. M4]MCA4135455.1 helix-turn-helix domain-containing protein [Arthrobacter sp. M4]